MLKNHGSVFAWLSLQHHGLGWHSQDCKDKQQNLAKVQINYQKEHKNTKNIKTGHKPTAHKQQMWWIIPERERGVAQSCCCRTCSDKGGNQTTRLLTWRTGKSPSKTRQKHTRKDLLSQMTDWLQWESACVVLDGNKKNLRAVPAGCGRGTTPHGGAVGQDLLDGSAGIGVNSGGEVERLCLWDVQRSAAGAHLHLPGRPQPILVEGELAAAAHGGGSPRFSWLDQELGGIVSGGGVSLENAEMKCLCPDEWGRCGGSRGIPSLMEPLGWGGGRRTDVVTFLPQDK